METTQLPQWVTIAVGAYFAYRLLNSARAEERKRRKQGEAHTRRDDALLLVAALSVIGVLVCAKFLKPLNLLVNSRAGMTATIILLGAALTYIFNRWRTPHS